MPRKIEISYRTIVFTVFFLILLWLLFQIRQILIGLFIAVVLMAAINPVIDRMERFKIPRLLGILLIYVLIFVLFGVIVGGVVPPLIDQTRTLVTRLPEYIEGISIPIFGQRLIDFQFSQLGSLPTNLVKISFSIFSNLLSGLLILVITLYLLLERKNLNRYLHVLFGGDGEVKAEKLIKEIESQLGGWVRAEMTLMVIIAAMTYVGLRLLGIDFALPLALLAGLFEVFPNFGPALSSIPAILAGLAVSPLMALAVAALYFLIQQIENIFVVPQVMSREAGVNPLVTIVALAVGFSLAGIIGAVLAVPVVLMAKVIASEVFASNRFKHL